MKYKIRKLDGRYSYREYFKHCIVFSNQLNIYSKDTEHFNNTLQWFTKTYGPSTEIRMWKSILDSRTRFGAILNQDPLPKYINFSWSWTNGYEDLRIYVKGDKELSFFKLANPVDSTR